MTMNYDEFYENMNDENFTPQILVGIDASGLFRAVSLDLGIENTLNETIFEAIDGLASMIKSRYPIDSSASIEVDEVQLQQLQNYYDGVACELDKSFYEASGWNMVEFWDIRA